MDWPHFSYLALGLSFAFWAAGWLTGIETLFLVSIAIAAVSLVLVAIQGFRD